MQRVGRVLHISPTGNIILKIENLSQIGETVIGENLKPVGRVFDIIGPVSAPYATIKPSIREPHKLLNGTLYVNPSRGERRR